MFAHYDFPIRQIRMNIQPWSRNAYTSILTSLSTLLFLGVLTAHGASANPVKAVSPKLGTDLHLDARLPFNPAIKTGKLKNGLSYYIFHNDTPQKRVELRLVVKAGSVQEDDDQQGLAHFTEHLSFNGSTHFKKFELISYLESIGLTFGADINAFTNADETVYVLHIPTDKKENLDTAFQVMEDWAHGVTMEDSAIDQERGVILEEARLNKGADNRIMSALQPYMLEGSKYANRIPIGKEDIIAHFPYDAVRRFYRDWYRPDLMAVIAVGDLDPARIEKLVRKHFTDIRNPVHERAHVPIEIPNLKTSKATVITDKEASSRAILIRYPLQRAKPETTVRDYRNLLIRELYVSLLAQRFEDLTEQANPPFVLAAHTRNADAAGYRSIVTTIVPGPAGVHAAIRAAIQEQESVRRFGFTAEEFDRAKKNRVRALEAADNEHDKTDSSDHASELMRNFLIQEPVPGIHNEFAYNRDLAPGISLEEMNQYAAKETPSGTPKLIAYLGSSKDGDYIPTEQQLLTWVDEAEKSNPMPRVQQTVAKTLMSHLPEPGTITNEKLISDIGVTELTLSNGVKVRLKPTNFRNDQVLLTASRFGGYSHANPDNVLNARYAPKIVQLMGVADFSPNDLAKVLAGKDLYVQTEGGAYVDTITGRSGARDVESMLQLLVLSMTAPRKDETRFHAFINSAKESSRNLAATPDAIFADATQESLSSDNPYAQLTPKPGDFDKISLDRAFKSYQDRFGSARDLTFNIVGSFNVETIKPLLARYLASLPTGEVDDKPADRESVLVHGVTKREVIAGTDDKAEVTMVFNGNAKFTPEENLHMRMMIEVVNARIVEVLRERMSLIYGGGVSGGIDRLPDESFRMSVNLPCGPDNVEKVIATLFAEIDKIKQNGPDPADLEKVRQGQLKALEHALGTNEAWLSSLQESSLFGTDPSQVTRVEQGIRDTTAQHIQDAAKRYFDMENYLQVILLPESAANKK